jgi:hypothetical protein
MKGSNTFDLNYATVIEALQEYFDKRINPKIKVDSISPMNGMPGGNTIRVTVKEAEAKP